MKLASTIKDDAAVAAAEDALMNAVAIVQALAETSGALSVLTGRGDPELDAAAAMVKDKLAAAIVTREKAADALKAARVAPRGKKKES